MTRKQKLHLNTIVGLLSQIVTFVCGFIVPKIILNYYGSEINGLVSSIIHFLSFISLAECGIGVVIQSSLYKPIADHNEDEISKIIISSDRFFRKIGYALILYVVVLCFTYPSLVSDEYKPIFTISLILAISISTFIQYYVCMSYRLLIVADQSGYIQLLLQILTQILITVASIILAKNGASIQAFKLGSSILLVLQPLLLTLYIKKNYKINKKLKLTEEPIKQKWNGFAQHIAYVVLGNTDTVVLTMFSTLSNVSVYNIYYLVVNGIKTLIMSTTSGVQSLLGNMYAKGEREKLNSFFSNYEWIMHLFVTFLFSCTSFLIVPFVKIYTMGINDTNYIAPIFGMLISLAQMVYCIRLPYNAMVFAAGHYRQTQWSAIIEASLNITISIVAVFKFGLIGVALGTLIAMGYRTIYLAIYLSNNILFRSLKYFIKHVTIDIFVIMISYFTTLSFDMKEASYYQWFLLSIKVALTTGGISIIINTIFYPQIIISVFNRIKQHD